MKLDNDILESFKIRYEYILKSKELLTEENNLDSQKCSTIVNIVLNETDIRDMSDITKDNIILTAKTISENSNIENLLKLYIEIDNNKKQIIENFQKLGNISFELKEKIGERKFLIYNDITELIYKEQFEKIPELIDKL